MKRQGEPRWPAKVLLIMRPTDEGLGTHGHPWTATIPIACKFLLDAGFEVELVDNLTRVKNRDHEEGLNSFDAVVFHGKLEQADDDAVNALHDFVYGGKGLVVIHIASASFAPNEHSVSQKWKDLIGSVWLYAPSDNSNHSYHPEPALPIKITVNAHEHPIMAGIPREFTLAKEELYQNMAVGTEGAGYLLASGADSREVDGQFQTIVEPVVFALEKGKGRVFNSYIGHFISTHLDPRFQKMIIQGIMWAAQV
jgi:type 1 glutamine amidotransferase